MKKKNNKKKIMHLILLFIITLIFIGSLYVKYNLAEVNFEEIVYYLYSGMANSDYSSVYIGIRDCAIFVILIFIVLYFLFYGIKIKNKEYNIKHFTNHKKIYTIVLLIISTGLLLYNLHLIEYLIDTNTNSNFIKDNYVNPKEANITFNNKRNLILIVVESLETSFFTKEQGGYWDYEIIPELHSLLEDEDSAITLNDGILNMKMLHGASWTTAAVVANTSGIPIKINFDGTGYSNNDFISGSYSLGDLLKDNGYYNEVISASNASFGGLKSYYLNHGDFTVIDNDSLSEYGLKMTKKDEGNWGFNDKYLFETAKKRLDIISKNNEPFDLQLITIDTHFFDGFVGEYSETKYNMQYENAYATTSRLISEFIDWLKEQPYYDNTTVVIVGDHLTMQSSFINDKIFDNRGIYSCIINPANNIKITKERTFTSLDTYPTIITSIGGNIEGNKLGLGVDIFSSEETLAEKYGLDKLDSELKKNSKYYNKEILKKDR